MAATLSIVVGVLYAAGLYMLMRRSIVKLLIGLGLLSHAANLLIFTTGGLTRGRAPLVAAGATEPPPLVADPLPQAVTLTAIVISFGVLAFAVALFQRAYHATGTEDIDRLGTSDS